jgi:prevent-host-death family protein
VKTASITEAKNKLSALIDLVRSGESVVIVERGRPVARLVPATAVDEDVDGRLARLERAGIVRIGRPGARVPLIGSKPPRTRQDASAVEALIDERRSGR